MNELTTAISKELESCSELLNVFQQERKLYCGSASIGISEITNILEQKKRLVEIFDRQHLLMKELREKGNACPADAQTANRDLMRRLGAVLEQLLVIDHENEKLLRENVSSRRLNNTPAPVVAGSENSRTRPALQRQMPFIPGARTVASAPVNAALVNAAPPVAAPIAVPRSAVEAEPATLQDRQTTAKHLLRRYIQGGKMSGLASKYA